jgi:hypothetical protein
MKSPRERGAALILLFTVLAALAAGAGLALLEKAASDEPARQQQLRSLALAADALRGEAFQRRCQTPTLPDDLLLPCPENGVEGQAAAACPGLTQGWLPWRTLELQPLRDASGTCLWYRRQGTTATVIAPGHGTPGQVRNTLPGRPVCGGNNNSADYLDAADDTLVLTLDTAAMAASCP